MQAKFFTVFFTDKEFFFTHKKNPWSQVIFTCETFFFMQVVGILIQSIFHTYALHLD